MNVTKTNTPSTVIPVSIEHETLGIIEVEVVVPTHDSEAAETLVADMLTSEVEIG